MSTELVGGWLKDRSDPCASSYPDELDLRRDGIYVGRMLPGSSVHPIWDVGTYEVRDGTVAISTANDAVIDYGLRREGDRLVFTDPAGCAFAYRRVA